MVGKPIARPGAMARRIAIGQALMGTTIGYTIREIAAKLDRDPTSVTEDLRDMMATKLVARSQIYEGHDHRQQQGQFRYFLTALGRGDVAA